MKPRPYEVARRSRPHRLFPLWMLVIVAVGVVARLIHKTNQAMVHPSPTPALGHSHGRSRSAFQQYEAANFSIQGVSPGDKLANLSDLGPPVTRSADTLTYKDGLTLTVSNETVTAVVGMQVEYEDQVLLTRFMPLRAFLSLGQGQAPVAYPAGFMFPQYGLSVLEDKTHGTVLGFRLTVVPAATPQAEDRPEGTMGRSSSEHS